MRRYLLALAGVLLIAACGGGNPDQDIRATFADYNHALGARNYAALCQDLAPETLAGMRLQAKRVNGGKEPPQDCASMLKLAYSAVDSSPVGQQTVTSIAKSAAIDKLTVKDKTATINWHATINGRRVPETLGARKIDGSWKLDDTQ